jgi:hypothetical protein
LLGAVEHSVECGEIGACPSQLSVIVFQDVLDPITRL